MRKLSQIVATAGLLLAIPFATFAHNGSDAGKGMFGFHGGIHWNFPRGHSGTVTVVGSSTFDFKTAKGDTFTVNTSGAKIVDISGNALTLANIAVNDKVDIRGTGSGNTITAKTVLVTPPNTHVASGRGKVTAINGSSLTVSQTNHGIVSSFTVNTSSSTVFTSSTTTTTLASVQVGSKITVKGLWDEIANVLNAIKIHIR